MSRKQTGGIVFFLSLVLLLLLSGCGTTKSESSKEENTTQAKVISPDDYPIVTITMEDNSTITLELYPDKAPNTVNNFVSLVNKGFYDGLIFHRIIPDFMIQGGDPNGNGTGGPGYSIKGEFSENGFENDLKHERGVISMARSQLPDSAGSQFFIMVADAPHLDGEYAPFGKVIEGMDVVDKIVSSKRDKNDKPVEEIKMKQVTVDTKGIDYEEPKKIKE
ncbi:peptidylprolyl isomerase [Niallia circulans]|uniref:peptidylprolyl isomerase n=1 Tax=Niallia circulans TaxID=1397 RepID=UPI000BA6D2F9|nr:peptidylprolyl isomerase [Niallia circulans]NRG34307.1 peptidylprolyl isomerase [Niallia circulans]PAE13668.1 peptidylprolyl isomerase [Niallia circulans]